MNFDWDDEKYRSNQEKHGVSFSTAQNAFYDPHRVIAVDDEHSNDEERQYCVEMIGSKILTVCFTIRAETIRIYSAGYWRKGRDLYEERNRIHRRTTRKTKGN